MNIFKRDLSINESQKQLRQKIFEKGREQGYQDAVQDAQCRLELTLKSIDQKLAEIDTEKIRTYKIIMEDVALIGQEVGKALSSQFFKKFPHEDIGHLLEQAKNHIKEDSTLKIFVHKSMQELTQKKLPNLTIFSDEKLGGNDVHITWEVGGLLSDKESVLKSIEESVTNFIESQEAK